jgi:predicted esterase
MNRREALARLGIGMAGIAAAGCDLGPSGPEEPISDGRMASRPSPNGLMPTAGVHALALNVRRDAYLYVPPGLPPGPAPLVVTLHGDPGSGTLPIQWFKSIADSLGCLLLAPSSQDRPWDAIITYYSHDALFIDRALAATFERCDVDPARIGLAGFSAGASYALALGRTNGDFFRRVTAFSPAFYLNVTHVGQPGFYVTHGIADAVAPIQFASREIVPKLEAAGYQVTYKEFVGGHVIPAELAIEAFTWMVGE